LDAQLVKQRSVKISLGLRRLLVKRCTKIAGTRNGNEGELIALEQVGDNYALIVATRGAMREKNCGSIIFHAIFHHP
jgi:hypothetical protein